MVREVSITFDDGTERIYQGVPDSVTPDQVEQRALSDSPGRKVKRIAGRVIDAPTVHPEQPLSTLDYVGKKFKQSALQTTAGLSILGGGIADLFGANDARDAMFGAASGMNDAATNQDIGVGTNDAAQTTGQRLLGAGAAALPMLAGAVASPTIAGLPLMSAQSMGDAGSNVQAGMDAATAGKVFATDLAGNVAGTYLPGSLGKRVAGKITSAIGMNVLQGGATDAAKHAIVAGDHPELAQKYDPANLDARVMDALFGTGVGIHAAMTGPRYAKPTPSPEALAELNYANNADNIQRPQATVADVIAANTGARNRPESVADFQMQQQEMARARQQRQKELNQTFYGVDLPPDMQASAVPASQEQAVRAAYEAQGINPDSIAAAFERGRQADGMDLPQSQRDIKQKQNNDQFAQTAFDIANLRQQRADADLATRNQIAPDYQGGNAAATGGMMDSGMRSVTLLNGRHPVEFVDDGNGAPLMQDGKVVVDVITPSGNKVRSAVDMSALQEKVIPANQRLSQDFVARSSEPQEGVGVGTMAGEKMPRRSTDRIAGDDIGGRTSPIADPYTKPNRTVEGTVEQSPPREPEIKAPRHGDTVDMEQPTIQRRISAGEDQLSRLEKYIARTDITAPQREQATSQADIVRRGVESLRAESQPKELPPPLSHQKAEEPPQARTEAPPVKPAPKAAPKKKSAKVRTLLTALRDMGGLRLDSKSDVVRDKFAPGGYNQLFRKDARFGIESHVGSGELDEFLPYDMRFHERNDPSAPPPDMAEAVDYIKEKIANGERVIPYDAQHELGMARMAEAYSGRNADDTFTEVSDDDINSWLREAAAENEGASYEGFSVHDTAHPDGGVDGGTGSARPSDPGYEPGADGGGRGDQGQQGSAERGAGDSFLKGQTEAEIKAEADKAKADAKSKAEADKAAEQKAKADREVNDFKLSGSDRAADANPDQGDLLSRKPQDDGKSPDDAAFEKALDDSYYHSINDTSKPELRRFIRKLVDKGLLSEGQLKNYDAMFKDRDMGAEDILNEVDGDLNFNRKNAAGRYGSDKMFSFGGWLSDPEFWKQSAQDAGFAAKKVSKAVGEAFGWGRDDANWVIKGIKRSTDLIELAKDPRGHAALGGVARQVFRATFQTYGGTMNTLANLSGSKTFKDVVNSLYTVAGDRSGAGVGLEHSIELEFAKREKMFAKSIDSIEALIKSNGLDATATWSAIANLVRNPHAIRSNSPIQRAASDIRKFLDESRKYMIESGVEVGEVKDGYYPREFDLSAVSGNVNGFKSALAQAYMENGATRKDAMLAADDLYATLTVGSDSLFKNSTGKPQAPFLKGRVFGKAVDSTEHPLNKFLISDPRVSLPAYLQRVVRRAELSRFLRDSSDAIAKDVGENASDALKYHIEAMQGEAGDSGSRWAVIRQKLLDDNVHEESISELTQFIQTIAGMNGQAGSAGAASSWIRTITTMALLEKATLSSLGEVLMPAIRSGNLLNIHRSVGVTLKSLIMKNADDVNALRELSEDLGIISSHMNDAMMSNRWGGGDEHAQQQASILSNNFKMTGLTQWTEATRMAAVKVGQTFVRRISQQSATSKLAVEHLGELGVPAKDAKEFSAWLAKTNDGMPTADDLRDAPDNMRKLYSTAIQKFEYQSIMRPNKASRPKWANGGFGAMIFQLQSYNYAFFDAVWKRGAAGAKRAVTGDYPMADRARLAMPLLMIPMLAAAQGMVGELRDAMLGDPEKKKTTQDKVFTAISRGIPIAPIDPMLNIVTAAKYDRRASEVLSGPALGSIGKLVDAGVAAKVRNSDATNNSERTLAKAEYDVLLEPAAAIVLANLYAEAPTAAKVGIAVARQVAGSGRARESLFVTPTAGAKQED